MTIDNRILVVDDEAYLRDILKIHPEELGYVVETAPNGQVGLELYRNQKPPIVMTDIKMHGMEGIELLQHIKEEDPESLYRCMVNLIQNAIEAFDEESARQDGR